MTRREVLEKIEDCEKNREFDVHVDPVDPDVVLPVDENFQYIKKGKTKISTFFKRLFIVKPFTLFINRFKTKTKVFGRENLKGIKKAIATLNHVYIFDCLVAKFALRGHDTNIVAAPFNNRKGFLGEMMRAGGMFPMSDNFTARKNFDKAITESLRKKKYVLFYPEQAMWWMYEKPRPHKIGAYFYAIKNKVPIIPMLITFKDTGKKDKEGISIKRFFVHIMKPIYAKNTLSDKENAEYLKNENMRVVKEKYEEFYNKKLEYKCT